MLHEYVYHGIFTEVGHRLKPMYHIAFEVLANNLVSTLFWSPQTPRQSQISRNMKLAKLQEILTIGKIFASWTVVFPRLPCHLIHRVVVVSVFEYGD